MARQVVIQDGYWMECLRSGSPVNVMLMTGETMTNWVVRRFDRYCVVFETQQGKENLVFKSGILMIEPVENGRRQHSNGHGGSYGRSGRQLKGERYP